jgi:hypothetical protein
MRRPDKSFGAAKASRLTVWDPASGDDGQARCLLLRFPLAIPGLYDRARVEEMRPPPATTRFTGAKARGGTAMPHDPEPSCAITRLAVKKRAEGCSSSF